jgi:hypothetical protein
VVRAQVSTSPLSLLELMTYLAPLAISTRNCSWGPRNIHYGYPIQKIFLGPSNIPGGRNRGRRYPEQPAPLERAAAITALEPLVAQLRVASGIYLCLG